MFYAIALNPETNTTKVIHNLADNRLNAIAEAENICKLNQFTLQAVFPYKNIKKEPPTLSKGNIQRNKGKKFYAF